MDYQLVVIRGRSSANSVKLQDGVTTAGRQDECQLRIKSSQVSRKHCQLFEKHGMLLVKDLGSSNGTFVNGKKIEGQRVMEPGDELGIGPIVFRIEKIGQPIPAGSPAQAGGTSPHDTAVAEAVPVAGAVPVATAIPDDEDFEIDFDSVPDAALDDDMGFEIELEDALSTPAPAVEAKPAMSPGLAASTKPSPKKSEPEPPPKQEDTGLADEAIADFLTGIKLDDD
jgi:predicted component of type VI protein secretion system